MDSEFWMTITTQVVVPILRITFFISLGLFVANFIESLNWTHRLAALARPLIKLGNLSSVTGASFSVAFFSGVSANTMLSEAFDKGQMTKKELILANLFNSLPRFFLHLPTVFFLTAPLIKFGAILYVGLTFCAATLQTLLVVLAGKMLLPVQQSMIVEVPEPPAKSNIKDAVSKSIKRLKKRIFKILRFMVPIYLLFFILNRFGLFEQLETFLVSSGWFLSWLNPQALGIVVLHVTTELSAGLAAASVLLAENSLTYKEVVLALLVGNILSTPIRAIRHQYPYYSGIYSPQLALELVGISQIARAGCVILITIVYYTLS